MLNAVQGLSCRLRGDEELIALFDFAEESRKRVGWSLGSSNDATEGKQVRRYAKSGRTGGAAVCAIGSAVPPTLTCPYRDICSGCAGIPRGARLEWRVMWLCLILSLAMEICTEK